MENAPEKFLKRYPKMIEFINLSDKDLNSGQGKRYSGSDKFGKKGPVLFYIVILIVTIQLA